MKLYFATCCLLLCILQSCHESTNRLHKKETMPFPLANMVRQYHRVSQTYNTNVYVVRFMNTYNTSRFIILPIINKGQLQNARPFKLLKVDTLFVLCQTGYESFEDPALISAADSVKIANILAPSLLPAPFDPIVWRGIIVNKDSILIEKEPKNPYGIDPCEDIKTIKFVPPSIAQ
jgi:hypothetical protein